MKYLVLLSFFVCTFFLATPVEVQASSDSAVQTAVLIVNVNTAGAPELQKLPGIGAVTAQSIIDYRSEVGGFSTIEDLLKVKGIGAKTLEGIRTMVEVN